MVHHVVPSIFRGLAVNNVWIAMSRYFDTYPGRSGIELSYRTLGAIAVGFITSVAARHSSRRSAPLVAKLIRSEKASKPKSLSRSPIWRARLKTQLVPQADGASADAVEWEVRRLHDLVLFLQRMVDGLQEKSLESLAHGVVEVVAKYGRRSSSIPRNTAQSALTNSNPDSANCSLAR